MSKHRPFIPPPRMTPPDSAPLLSEQAARQASAAIAQTIQAPAAQQSTATTLAIVPPPPRVGSVVPYSDRLLFTNPAIELVESIFLADGKQVRKLYPAAAYVAHGMIVIEELKLALPVGGALIRI